MNFRSAFSQIVWLQVLAVAATSLVMPIALYLFLERTVADYQVKMLRQREQVLLQAMTPAPAAGVALPASLTEPYAQEISGFSFAISDPHGRLLTSSAGDPALAPLPTARRIEMFRRKTGKGAYVGVSVPEDFHGQPIWIQVQQNQDNPDVVLDDVQARFLPAVVTLSAGVLLFLLLADIVIVRRALGPIVAASGLAGAISPTTMDLRLPTQRMPSEILPLVEAVNQAFDRLEHGFRAQRDLTADVAHELRTPLAVLRLRAEALVDPLMRARILADIDVMTRLVAQLLSVAELEMVIIGPDETADLHQACLEVVEHLAPLAVKQGKAIELEGSEGPVWVHGRSELLFQAVRNLVENAIRHSPPGGAVTVEVAAAGAARVLDRGPGVPGELKNRLFERFWRARRKERSSVGAGAGLGLSIVAQIAEQHGGQVSVDDRPGGGAVFSLVLRPVRKSAAAAA
ncbi:MAG TPA: ATP-binding protein [Caulobacteraceae bacterium]|jgi:signal transduction histidine kinase